MEFKEHKEIKTKDIDTKIYKIQAQVSPKRQRNENKATDETQRSTGIQADFAPLPDLQLVD